MAGSEESLISPRMGAKLKAATEKASRDFRSDVMTVPTESMMEVRRLCRTMRGLC